jgi:hypothetical protein
MIPAPAQTAFRASSSPWFIGSGTGTTFVGGAVGNFAGAIAGILGSGSGSGAPGFSFFFGLVPATAAFAGALEAPGTCSLTDDGAEATIC